MTVDTTKRVQMSADQTGPDVSLTWTPLGLYQNASLEGNRFARSIPMCSDGHFIYCLVRYNELHFQSKIVKIVCEIYELDHQKHREICRLSRVGEVTLYRNDSYEPFIGRRKILDVNYLTNGSLACNGELLVWRSRCKIHIFSLETGVRLHKEEVKGNVWISTHDNLDNYFYQTSH